MIISTDVSVSGQYNRNSLILSIFVDNTEYLRRLQPSEMILFICICWIFSVAIFLFYLNLVFTVIRAISKYSICYYLKQWVIRVYLLGLLMSSLKKVIYKSINAIIS